MRSFVHGKAAIFTAVDRGRASFNTCRPTSHSGAVAAGDERGFVWPQGRQTKTQTRQGGLLCRLTALVAPRQAFSSTPSDARRWGESPRREGRTVPKTCTALPRACQRSGQEADAERYRGGGGSAGRGLAHKRREKVFHPAPKTTGLAEKRRHLLGSTAKCG